MPDPQAGVGGEGGGTQTLDPGTKVAGDFFAQNPPLGTAVYLMPAPTGGDDYLSVQNKLSAIPSNGGWALFQVGTYTPSQPWTVSQQNLRISGPNWSFTQPNFSFGGSPNLPLTVFKPLGTFPANRWVLEVNNTALQVTGFALENLAFDGGAVTAVSGVGAIRGSNLVGARFENFAIMDKFNGDAITIDQNGATYAPPSTSQLWFKRFIIWDIRGAAINFVTNLFISEVFISEFMMAADVAGVKTDPAQSSGFFDFHIFTGYIANATSGLILYTNSTYIDDLYLEGLFNHGIYVKQTSGTPNRKSWIKHTFIRNPDRNANGSSAVLIDAGCRDYFLDTVVCWHDNFGEIGINIVDGLAAFIALGGELRSNCRAYGFTTANFKYGATNYSSNYPPPLPPSTVVAGASPWTYTNNDGFPEALILTTVAGTTAISWKGIAGQPITANAFPWIVAPGEAGLVVTWSGSAPTLTKCPLSTSY